jgi:hypothetical protein
MNLLDYDHMKSHLGMVIPVWFPPDTGTDIIRRNIQAALAGWERYFRPEAIVLSVDGCRAAAAIIDRMTADNDPPLPPGLKVIASEPNRGKGRAVALGFEELLRDDNIEFLVARDVDGDHLINDLENLYRIALQARDENSPGVLIIGRRHNLHAPLGFQRAEFEIWSNRCLLEACQFRLGLDRRVFDRKLCSAYADHPDFQSGYKLYSRAVVENFLPLVLDPPETDREIIWHGSEVVPVVATVLMGATIAEVTRMTAGEQPISGYGGIDRAAFYGGKLNWAFRRLEIDPEPAQKILQNHLARSKLFWSAEGRDELIRACEIAIGGNFVPPPIQDII